METLIAFSCYYRVDDGRKSGKMKQFYTQALARYKNFQYSEFHRYIRKMQKQYMIFAFPSTKSYAEDDPGSAEEGDIVNVPVAAGLGPQSYVMSSGR